MPSVTVDVDIEMYEIDTCDLLDEIKKRIKRAGKGRKGISEIERAELMHDMRDFLDDDQPGIVIQTLDDKMKMEHIVKVFGKYTSVQVESALPEY